MYGILFGVSKTREPEHDAMIHSTSAITATEAVNVSGLNQWTLSLKASKFGLVYHTHTADFCENTVITTIVVHLSMAPAVSK